MKIGETWMDKRPEYHPYFYGQVTIENIYKNCVVDGISQRECVGFTTSRLRYIIYKRENFVENFEKVY